MPLQANALLIIADPTQAQRVAERLEPCGITAQTAPDCLTAMGLVKGTAFEFVILGDGLGHFDAIDTTRVLKSLRTDRYLPVLVMAERELTADRHQQLLAAGVDDVLPPDFDGETLMCRLHPVLRLKSAHDQLKQVQDELARTLARENTLLKQLREDNRNLKVRSITDGLTALYNYRYLMEWLKTEFKISRRYGHSLSMIIADLDHFKRINDEYGHPFGDYALKEVAVVLKQCARESDLVARYAGDEFALICPRTGHKEVQALAKRILVACRKHRFDYMDKRVPLTLSLGTATYPEDAEVVSPEMLVFLADQALYQAKRLGRNTTASWHEIDPQTRMAIRCELQGPNHPLLADDAKSRLELAAAAHLVQGMPETTSLPLPTADQPAESQAHEDGRSAQSPCETGWPSSK